MTKAKPKKSNTSAKADKAKAAKPAEKQNTAVKAKTISAAKPEVPPEPERKPKSAKKNVPAAKKSASKAPPAAPAPQPKKVERPKREKKTAQAAPDAPPQAPLAELAGDFYASPDSADAADGAVEKERAEEFMPVDGARNPESEAAIADTAAASAEGAASSTAGESGSEAGTAAVTETVNGSGDGAPPTDEALPASTVTEDLTPPSLHTLLEALLFAAEEPLTAREMARAAGHKPPAVRDALIELRDRYTAEGRPWELLETGGGYRLVTRPRFYPAIQKLRAQRTMRKLTQAALETLALIAYSKDPIGRAEIEQVRGVEAGPVLKQLLERRLIQITGRGTGVGQPLLYGISTEFLSHFGLRSATELPQPGELRG